MKFTHLRNQEINMVDISKKKSTSRSAIAVSYVRFTKKSFKKLIDKGSPKGEIFNTARCAGILGAKKTSDNIIKICESGINNNKQLYEYSKNGADAFLIGESLMKSEDIEIATKNLIKK